MNNQLTREQKELRKVNKKIRHLKAREGSWDMENIRDLEGQRDILEKRFCLEDKAKVEADAKEENENKMTDDDWIDRFREDQGEIHQDIDSHIIPNNRETRLHRKHVIQNLQEHLAEEYMRQQILLRFSIINGIKEKLMEEKNTITS
jgi:hypothetical protein